MIERITSAEVEEGARAVYVAARKGITCERWDDLPDWRKRRWIAAYWSAMDVHRRYERPARSVRLARAS